jgi:hypothetical protein
MGLFKNTVKLPDNPVTLSVQQVDEFNRKLSKMRHDIANHMTVIITAAELASHAPEKSKDHLVLLLGQTPKITESVRGFTTEFDKILGIIRT